MRKPRSDSKIRSLPAEQRALVDKWLFDKGMTYQQVADGCREVFGLEVSRSSVGRYCGQELALRLKRPVNEELESDGEGNEPVSEEVAGSAAAYQWTLKWMADWALAELRWPEPEDAEIKLALRVIRILMAARLEANDAAQVELAWEKFRMKAARECLREARRADREEAARARRHGRETWYPEAISQMPAAAHGHSR